MSAADAARHIAGTSARDLALVANRHVTVGKLNEAITDVINAYARLDLIKAWGDGSSVAADGTHMDTYLDNLLAETSIRYGASGGIACHHISDHYIALFTHFVPCGVWKAVYIIEGLLKNASEIQPTTIPGEASYPLGFRRLDPVSQKASHRAGLRPGQHGHLAVVGGPGRLAVRGLGRCWHWHWRR
jgi:hypothetical protein